MREIESSQVDLTWQTAVEEINRLHDKVLGSARTSLNDAIRIGEILTQVKGALKHGEWLPWIEKYAPFSVRTSQNYIRCFERMDELKNASVAYLSDAYSGAWNGSGNGSASPDKPQQLHEPNFHSQAVRLRQNLIGLFNHYLQRRPLNIWRTEEIYDLLSSLKPLTEICQQLEVELGTRSDVPATYG